LAGTQHEAAPQEVTHKMRTGSHFDGGTTGKTGTQLRMGRHSFGEKSSRGTGLHMGIDDSKNVSVVNRLPPAAGSSGSGLSADQLADLDKGQGRVSMLDRIAEETVDYVGEAEGAQLGTNPQRRTEETTGGKRADPSGDNGDVDNNLNADSEPPPRRDVVTRRHTAKLDECGGLRSVVLTALVFGQEVDRIQTKPIGCKSFSQNPLYVNTIHMSVAGTGVGGGGVAKNAECFACILGREKLERSSPSVA